MYFATMRSVSNKIFSVQAVGDQTDLDHEKKTTCQPIPNANHQTILTGPHTIGSSMAATSSAVLTTKRQGTRRRRKDGRTRRPVDDVVKAGLGAE